jgi:hypothetical protein
LVAEKRSREHASNDTSQRASDGRGDRESASAAQSWVVERARLTCT